MLFVVMIIMGDDTTTMAVLDRLNDDAYGEMVSFLSFEERRVLCCVGKGFCEREYSMEDEIRPAVAAARSRFLQNSLALNVADFELVLTQYSEALYRAVPLCAVGKYEFARELRNVLHFMQDRMMDNLWGDSESRRLDQECQWWIYNSVGQMSLRYSEVLNGMGYDCCRCFIFKDVPRQKYYRKVIQRYQRRFGVLWWERGGSRVSPS